MTFDTHTDKTAIDITDVITDWMAVSGNAELGLLDLVFLDQLIHQKPQRKPSHR